jgi:hypothetical protein
VKCPYSNPTIVQCNNCHLPDCVRDEKQDQREQVERWRKDNPERVKEIRHNQYIKNREKEKAYQKQYYQKVKNTSKYKEDRAAYMREYRAMKKEERVM